ncbi:RES family NAD+ phosphorylase [Pseudomonas sp. BE134]|uniref:RES family NAD+ phosphorylase n=1 Tax=Pseudomonas sp. BE134 TaxID=2817843 RepID=UPI0028676445|nr:RES family NAD+ phosphorylase [Pseudomonas sp. BE134]MDR6924797.1 hypothetical protein [Pseudomonas sp. BE134]
MEQQNDELQICHQCVGEQFLSREIKTTGKAAKCNYCESESFCWTIEALADRIEQAFAEHFIRTSPEPDNWEQSLLENWAPDYTWERHGEPVLWVIGNTAEIPDQAGEDVLDMLSRRHDDFEMKTMGEESEFAPTSHYEPKDLNAYVWQQEWRNFERTLRTEARYFGRAATAHLAAVFGGIDRLSTSDGKSLVVSAGPGTSIEALFRARVFQADKPLKEALCRPDQHLSSPPARMASAGRMNARGISVFYGATAKVVALAEVRPPVGSYVVLASFKVIRPLRLLNLSALENTHDDGSLFDPALLPRLERVAFLRTLGRKMTRPVMPDDQEFDYLATQAVADFLATENAPLLDGIIFESTQSDEGANIVLFHSASRVAIMDLPEGTDISASTVSHDEDGAYPDYWVREEVPPAKEEEPAPKPGIWPLIGMLADPQVDHDARQETLDILPDTIEVHHIKKVRVESDAYTVVRHRYQKRENAHF